MVKRLILQKRVPKNSYSAYLPKRINTTYSPGNSPRTRFFFGFARARTLGNYSHC